MKRQIKIFISYSWDDKHHQIWVEELASTITSHGGQVILDKRLNIGGNLRLFMERQIMQADIVIIVLTPVYKAKAHGLKGGVGYEYLIITKELFRIIDNNSKYLPILRRGSHTESVPDFLEDFKYIDLRDHPDYIQNLNQLLQQIFHSKNMDMAMKRTRTSKIVKEDYENLDKLTTILVGKFKEYFARHMNAQGPASTKRDLAGWLQRTEEDINKYSSALKQGFNPAKMNIAVDYKEDFKNKVFGMLLRTVLGRFAGDPEFAAYRTNFKYADEEEVYNKVNAILNATHAYVADVACKLDYSNISEVEGLKIGFLNDETMFMEKIIGASIRSELLHRYYPGNFPAMMQKSLWGMFFLSGSEMEFLKDKHFGNQNSRLSHNWQYPYDRFTYILNCLANALSACLREYNLYLKQEYRFGYVHAILGELYDMHKDRINNLSNMDKKSLYAEIIQ